MLVYREEEFSNSLLKMFAASFRSKETARAYDYHLKRYCNDLETVRDPSSLLTLTQKDAEDTLILLIILSLTFFCSFDKYHVA